MSRSLIAFVILLAASLALGCRNDKPTADGSSDSDGKNPPAVDGTSDGKAGDGTATGGNPPTTDPGKIVTPTKDDSPERAKAREMDVAALIDALGDEQLAKIAADELASRGTDAVKPLVDALDDDSADVQHGAAYALGQMGAAANEALPKLKALAENSDSEVVQDAASFAIDGIQGK